MDAVDVYKHQLHFSWNLKFQQFQCLLYINETNKLSEEKA